MTLGDRHNEFPSIRLDDADRITSSPQGRSAPTGITSETAPASTGVSWLWLLLLLLVAGASAAGGYYLWMLTEKQTLALLRAEERIALLEKALSATGEEIGESTVALQVKVNELNERSNELWKEMDKLWASAWRRNQKELSEVKESLSGLEGRYTKTADESKKLLASLAEKNTGQDNQLASLADEILSLNVQLEQSNNSLSTQTKTLKQLTSEVTSLEQQNKALAQTLTALDKQVKSLATPASSARAQND